LYLLTYFVTIYQSTIPILVGNKIRILSHAALNHAVTGLHNHLHSKVWTNGHSSKDMSRQCETSFGSRSW